MGAHVEGPYLHEKQAGTHDPALFVPYYTSKLVYGQSAMTNEIIKLATVAPDVDNASSLIKDLSGRGIRVSLGHTPATYDMGLDALSSGASCLTHMLNCMAPLQPRDPGLTGLISLPHNHRPPPPYYTVLGDGVNLHPQVAALLLRVNMKKAILATNGSAWAGRDGLHSRNARIYQQQRRVGTRATSDSTGTLANSHFTIDQGVRNLMNWSGCTLAEAVRTATENVADFMGVPDRGKLEEGRRADFIVLDDEGYLQETWIAGVKVWSK
jgi:N-acetylglucosamine-6-phosphate deacetylase